jgi:phosphatidylglycerophosphatase A
MKKVLLFIATFGYIGYAPIAPGTAASLVTAVLVYLIRPYWQAPFYIQLAVIFIVFLLGIPAGSYAEKHFAKKDPGHCVIDEVAGQMLCLLLVPHKLGLYIAAFFLFRFFDILKPFPIKYLERAPHGLGIMIDDLGAGLYALGLLQLFLIRGLF